MSSRNIFKIYTEVRVFGLASGVRKEDGGSVRFENHLLFTEHIHPDFSKNITLEQLFKSAGSFILENESELSVYPDVTVRPSQHYEKASHYYHDALRKLCYFKVRETAPEKLIEQQSLFTEITGKSPTIPNVSFEMVSGLKNSNERIPFDILQNLQEESYANILRSETAALSIMKNHSLTLDSVNIKAAAASILKTERAVERLGIEINQDYVIKIFNRADRLTYDLSVDIPIQKSSKLKEMEM